MHFSDHFPVNKTSDSNKYCSHLNQLKTVINEKFLKKGVVFRQYYAKLSVSSMDM